MEPFDVLKLARNPYNFHRKLYRKPCLYSFRTSQSESSRNPRLPSAKRQDHEETPKGWTHGGQNPAGRIPGSRGNAQVPVLIPVPSPTCFCPPHEVTANCIAPWPCHSEWQLHSGQNLEARGTLQLLRFTNRSCASPLSIHDLIITS